MWIENYNGNFVDIEGFEDYMISDIGTVYSKKSNKLLSPGSDSQGHLLACLYLNGKATYKYVHRLVAEAFIEKPSEEHTDVHHINHCSTDNRPENLMWIPHAEHMSLHRENGYKSRIVVKCLENGKTYNSLIAAANDLGIQTGQLSRHLKGKIKHVKGYHFEKIEVDN